jgi:glycosyltransferase involved in cell wall biosynthesis
VGPEQERLQRETFVCFGWSDWEPGTQTWNHVLRRLAYRNRVLFVPPPLERTEVLGSRYAPNGKHGGVRHLEAHLYVYRYPRILPTFYKPRAVARWMEDRQADALRRAMRRLGAESPILYLLHPKFRRYIGVLGEKLVLYHVLDEYAGYIGANKARLRAEEDALLDRADLVLCSAPSLLAAKNAPNRNVHFVPNGVDFERFRPDRRPERPLPEDLSVLRRPRAGYIGRICDKLDFALLRDVARLLPDVSFVAAGPALVVLRQNRVLFEEWASLPNVHLLGMKRSEELPACVRGFDVGILPYAVNEETRHRYPLKLHEYLAAGKPVVSVPLPCFEGFEDLVRTAADPETFARAVRDALRGEAPETTERRISLARRHDWNRIVLRIDELVLDRLRMTRGAPPQREGRAASPAAIRGRTRNREHHPA